MGDVLPIIRTILLLVGLSLYGVSAFGQAFSGGAGVQQRRAPGQESLPREELDVPQVAPELVLPPLAPPDDAGRLSAQLRVFVRKFRFEGNQIFTDSELAIITAPYEGRVITSAELQRVRNEVSLFYLNKGYINSGAIIPDQKVEDNVITLQIIEGGLTRVEIAGNTHLTSGYLISRLKRAAGKPLNIEALEKELKILQQHRLIKRLHAELKPGDRLGESVLRVQLEENRPGRVDVSFNNYRPPSVGAEQVEIDATYYSLTGHDDTLTAYFGHTRGLDDLFLSYRLPVNSHDTRVGVYFQTTDSEVVEEPFDELDIESDAKTWGVIVTHPLRRTPAGHLTAGMALERRHSNTSLGGIPFPFSEGVGNDGRADVTPVRLSIDWLSRDLDSVLAARSVVSMGIDALGATTNNDAPDGRFVAWSGQFQWLQRFGQRGYQAVIRASAQLTNDALLPLEKFVVGGHDTVRGYRENQLVRDNGFTASAELRIPIFQGEGAAAQWQIAPFVDYGNAWEEEADTPDPRDITSVGAELRWQPTRRLQASVSAAHAFENIDRVDQDRDLQDRGIQFLLSYQLF